MSTSSESSVAVMRVALMLARCRLAGVFTTGLGAVGLELLALLAFRPEAFDART